MKTKKSESTIHKSYRLCVFLLLTPTWPRKQSTSGATEHTEWVVIFAIYFERKYQLKSERDLTHLKIERSTTAPETMTTTGICGFLTHTHTILHWTIYLDHSIFLSSSFVDIYFFTVTPLYEMCLAHVLECGNTRASMNRAYTTTIFFIRAQFQFEATSYSYAIYAHIFSVIIIIICFFS